MFLTEEDAAWHGIVIRQIGGGLTEIIKLIEIITIHKKHHCSHHMLVGLLGRSEQNRRRDQPPIDTG